MIEGKSWSEISETLGMARGSNVHRMLIEKFQLDARSLTGQERDDLLGMELLRLNALQSASWPAAMMGDPKAIDSCIKIIQTRVRITGLEQVDPVVNKNLVLVVGEQEEDYIAALQAATDTD